MTVKASITKHTTASLPRPHVLYVVDVVPEHGKAYSVVKRYSDFVELKNAIGDAFTFPPKRILATTFIPSAWVDDKLIAEREAGLSAYLSSLLGVQAYAEHPAVVEFLAPSPAAAKAARFDAEDALPSTLSRKDAAALSEAGDEVNAEASFVAASYYPYWAVDSNPPENIDFSKFDILFFAFAMPSSSNGVSFDSGATNTLKRLVAAANKSGKGTKIVLSVGGWGGCQYFHQAMSSSANRGVFIAALANTVNTYGLAGIDIDWEYPNDPGAGQPYGSADAANLLTFFTYLRKSLGSSKIISAAVTQQPWKGSNGSPLTDVSAYAAQMNYVNIMNYDVWGSSSTPGPNAPLSNACNTSSQPQASAQAALNQWTKAKFPANKLLLGLPTYGYVSKSTKTVLSGAFALPGPPADAPVNEHTERVRALATSESQNTITVDDGVNTEPVEEQPLNDLGGAHDVEPMRKMMARRVNPDTVEAAATGDLSAYFGQQIAFNQIVALGALKKSGSVYVQNNGYTQAWDNCSDTPFLFNASRQTVVTYDDTYSLADKAALAKNNNMAGCFTWSLDQDDGYTLQNVIRKSLGKS